MNLTWRKHLLYSAKDIYLPKSSNKILENIVEEEQKPIRGKISRKRPPKKRSGIFLNSQINLKMKC